MVVGARIVFVAGDRKRTSMCTTARDGGSAENAGAVIPPRFRRPCLKRPQPQRLSAPCQPQWHVQDNKEHELKILSIVF